MSQMLTFVGDKVYYQGYLVFVLDSSVPYSVYSSIKDHLMSLSIEYETSTTPSIDDDDEGDG
jgi:hypothetical protein